MLDSLDRIDRFSKRVDRLLGPEPEPEPEAADPNDPDTWSTETVLGQYQDDPIGWIRDIAGTDLWRRQIDVALAVVANRRVAVRSGHKVGKTRLLALLAVWWVTTRAAGSCIATAPTDRQVKRAFWKEVRWIWKRLQRRGIQIMPEPALDPATGVRWDDGRELFGFTASSADNVSGPSGAEMLVIVDEGPGVPSEVWQALQGMRAGGGRVVTAGNPTQTVGWFYEAFQTREGWCLLHISSRESPNVVEGRTVIPGLADRDYIAELEHDYGRDSPIVAVRADGNFPQNVANAVIGTGMLELALERGDEFVDAAAPDGSEPLDLGVDVARFGDDDSAVAARTGLRGLGCTAANGYDGPMVAGLVIQQIREYRQPGQSVRIRIDIIGYGSSVYDHLMFLLEEGTTPELDGDVVIIGVNVAELPDDDEDRDKYERKRDQLWFGLRFWIAAGGSLPRDPKAEREIVAPTYKPTARGKYKVEDKLELKKKLGRSPDRADAWCLATSEIEARIDDSWVDEAAPLTRWDQNSRGFG